MALNPKQKKILAEAKDKLKVMSQVSRLEKEIASFRKKLEMKESKLFELINILDDHGPEIKSSFESKDKNGKPGDPSALFSEG